ncbi:FHA domain-containing protein [Leptolyngbya sp. FACHB-36]|uniref:FHA domain-containing protein n=1 Tax=Leptolyngbya sp. FACHB-36 TaxID=2692808 RepID=UPI001680D14C|nr:FHA domain-containing protein [Leptolyngbya sp. FACHB-36]MBD2019514.1 FHA domain-containing protein [Leptolyngbya sp. FACHB-36]
MPSEPRQNHFLIIQDDIGRREYALNASMYSIGRDPQCDIRLISQFVSRRHATLVQILNDDGSYYYRIVDGYPKGEPSVNGIRINGRKRKAHDLEHDDEIVFGPQVLATYLALKRDAYDTTPPDEFDITLISPGMVDEPEDDEPEDEDNPKNGAGKG